ncbi:MAG: hypothetical protein ACYTG7_20055 [Planctomycetota bacterium]|jgi:hypothetical protein
MTATALLKMGVSAILAILIAFLGQLQDAGLHLVFEELSHPGLLQTLAHALGTMGG